MYMKVLLEKYSRSELQNSQKEQKYLWNIICDIVSVQWDSFRKFWHFQIKFICMSQMHILNSPTAALFTLNPCFSTNATVHFHMIIETKFDDLFMIF